MANKTKGKRSNPLSDIAVGSGGLFLLIFGGLFLMLVSTTCAEVGADYALKSDDLAEKIITIPLSAAAALIGAGMATAAFSLVSVAITAGYRMLLAGRGVVASRRDHLVGAATGIGTMLVSAVLGGWRMQAGFGRGEPGWLMQGTVVAAVGVIVGFMVALPSLALAIRTPSGKSGRPPKPPKQNEGEDDDAFPSEVVFVFLAVLGMVMSFGVVEYVHIARAQAGKAPLPVGEFVDGYVRRDHFEGYPEKAELVLPAGLEGPHAIVFIEVSPCQMKLVRGKDKPVKVKRVAAKRDDDGDATEYARLVFEAKRKRRYRLLLSETDGDCLYSVRLVKERSE